MKASFGKRLENRKLNGKKFLFMPASYPIADGWNKALLCGRLLQPRKEVGVGNRWQGP